MKRNRDVFHGIVAILLIVVINAALSGVEELTESGRLLVAILIATLYLWNMVNKLWDNFFPVVAIGFAGALPMTKALASFWGSPVVIQNFCMMTLMINLVHHKIPSHLGKLFLKQRWLHGRPWAFTLAIFLFGYLLSWLIGPFAPVFLAWPMVMEICEKVGYTRDDRYPGFLLVNVLTAAMLGFATPIYLGYALGLDLNFRKICESLGSPAVIPVGRYLLMAITLSVVICILNTLVGRFILRLDVSKMKNFNEELVARNDLPAMDKRQKTIAIIFLVYVLLMFLPNALPQVGPILFLAKNTVGMSLAAVVLLMAVYVEGRPLLTLNDISGAGFPWGMFLRVCSALMLGSLLTDSSTGLANLIQARFLPLFDNMSYLSFLIIFILLIVLLSNVFNSMIVSMLIQPVAILYCLNRGISPVPISSLLIFLSLSSAALFPGGSAFSYVLYSNKDKLHTKEILLYGSIFVTLVILCNLAWALLVQHV